MIYLTKINQSINQQSINNDFMTARTSPYDFVDPYNFSISLTCGFALGRT